MERRPEQSHNLAIAKAAAVRPVRWGADRRLEKRKLRVLRFSAFRWNVCSSNRSFAGIACCFPQNDPARSISPFARNYYYFAATNSLLAAADSAGTMSARTVAA